MKVRDDITSKQKGYNPVPHKSNQLAEEMLDTTHGQITITELFVKQLVILRIPVSSSKNGLKKEKDES
ncbi:MAG: hypothetical protein K0S01_2496 [Herbinix sp.]|jgi:hypothetical protein|nr:hypothetical protein [Herbinix sp.]